MIDTGAIVDGWKWLDGECTETDPYRIDRPENDIRPSMPLFSAYFEYMHDFMTNQEAGAMIKAMVAYTLNGQVTEFDSKHMSAFFGLFMLIDDMSAIIYAYRTAEAVRGAEGGCNDH